jgi:pimeloyl-ACP methyl ester carboxylesterase
MDAQTDRSDWELKAGGIRIGTRALRWVEAGRGQPSVVLEAGISDSSAGWQAVMVAVAAHTRVVAYDRAGLGASDPVSGLPTLSSQVDDLATVVRSVGAPGVVVGQSWGGLLARLLAARHPELVLGLVLVDPYHEDLVGTLPGWVRWVLGVGNAWVWLPLRRWIGGATPGQLAELRGLAASFSDLEPPTLPDRPVVVLSASRGLPGPLRRRWTELQASIADSVPGGRHLMVDCGHDIHRSQPQVVVDAILAVLDQVRGSHHLDSKDSSGHPEPEQP